jgi:hypothetical protein
LISGICPTKGLNHLKAGLEEFITSLRDHGLAEPILGFTDNVASDAGTFLECIPSFNKDVEPVSMNEFSDFPQLVLPEGVSVVCAILKQKFQVHVLL